MGPLLGAHPLHLRDLPFRFINLRVRVRALIRTAPPGT